jgi:uncharacterized membrane protein YsdA (DUF1294 family)
MLAKAVLTYLLVLNAATYTVFGIDKRRARRRVPEAVLTALAAMGGSIGALAAMRTFRHKTTKWKFRLGIPAILILQLALLVFYLYRHNTV